MRISTSTIYDSGAARISDLQVALNKTNQQMSTGRRVLTPSDDPIASARALVISQSDSVNDQYAVNRRNGKNALNGAENILASVTSTLQSVKTLIVNAGNGSLTDVDRGYIATQLQGNLDQMLSLANSTDETGNYMFSGFTNTVMPYVKTANGANYVGDQGQRFVQADTSRQIAMGDVGPAVFGNIRTSKTAFAVAANSANLGKGVISGESIANAALLTGNNYEIKFSSATNFDVLNKTTGLPALSAQTYTSGSPIVFDGIQVNITDTPTAPGIGDSFSIQPGNQNIFETLTDLINVLRTSSGSLGAKADLSAGLAQANNNVDASLSNVIVSRTNMGTSLKEIDTLDESGDGIGLVYKKELAELQDLDYVKAITELKQQEVTLQAAQQSFVKTSSLSLFNYIS
ncbi:flagellar hook-associated protein FlgL [Undibacterium parvum]|uniref:Flagellar hook-associated protein 3 n=1 Tax=Undibacterium parvum TaxID=401471 RepID=A0A3Q9BUI9_9BURK|nr:flagellar hook-associated protein FlgL [Undibacterium parvum]AZP13760.1 flagellar hook-associated protein 3 [Undibacterium parvum]